MERYLGIWHFGTRRRWCRPYWEWNSRVRSSKSMTLQHHAAWEPLNKRDQKSMQCHVSSVSGVSSVSSDCLISTMSGASRVQARQAASFFQSSDRRRKSTTSESRPPWCHGHLQKSAICAIQSHTFSYNAFLWFTDLFLYFVEDGGQFRQVISVLPFWSFLVCWIFLNYTDLLWLKVGLQNSEAAKWPGPQSRWHPLNIEFLRNALSLSVNIIEYLNICIWLPILKYKPRSSTQDLWKAW